MPGLPRVSFHGSGRCTSRQVTLFFTISMLKPDVPRKAVYRLSLYHRGLQRLRANRVHTVSSAALGAQAL